MTSLRGKVAAVTGSTSGIGLGIAESLAAQGADIALNGFGDPAAIAATRARLADAHGVRVIHLGSDMSTGPGAASFVSDTVAALGKLDILVNNAGIQHVAPVDEFPPEKWDALIAICLSATFHTTRAAVPAMKAAKWGRIINIASAHGLVASPFKSAYVAAKHGVVGFTKSVALELAETGITCNAVCPGYVRTALVDGQIGDQAKAHGMSEDEVIRNVILAVQPTKRFVTVEELGAFVNFICSDAAGSMTGAALSMDGGWTSR